jgi:hypothetical protein
MGGRNDAPPLSSRRWQISQMWCVLMARMTKDRHVSTSMIFLTVRIACLSVDSIEEEIYPLRSAGVWKRTARSETEGIRNVWANLFGNDAILRSLMAIDRERRWAMRRWVQWNAASSRQFTRVKILILFSNHGCHQGKPGLLSRLKDEKECIVNSVAYTTLRKQEHIASSLSLLFFTGNNCCGRRKDISQERR